MVMVAIVLMKYGKPDEDLFGMICRLLSYPTSFYLDKRDFKPVEFLTEFYQENDTSEGCACERELRSPAEFAKVLDAVHAYQSPMHSRNGWKVFVLIITSVEEQYTWSYSGNIPQGCMRKSIS